MTDNGRNEADRLRVILETLLFAQPELKLAEALPMVWEIEKRTLALESPGEAAVPGSTDPESVARWISRAGQEDIRDLIIDGKLINAIKEVRAKTFLGLKEAKDAVEFWKKHFHP